MTRAQDLFDRISTGGYAEIIRMVREAEPEELFLDYKRVRTEHPNKLHDDDRNNFAKAVSGFGNSDGGLLIWGVDCHKSRGDIPSAIIPIEAKWFKTLLDGAVSGVTLPPHGGVESICVFDPAGPGGTRGIVVSHVPPGFDVPLYGVPSGARNYYMRAGSSFLPVPHGVLAGMFGRKPQAAITLDASVRIFDFESMLSLTFSLFLNNSGRASAEDLYVVLHVLYGPDSHHNAAHTTKEFSARENSLRNNVTFVTTKDFVRLPPRDAIDVGQIQTHIKDNDLSHGLLIRGTCGTTGAPASAFKFLIDGSTLQSVSQMLKAPHNDQTFKEAMRILNEAIKSGI